MVEFFLFKMVMLKYFNQFRV